MLAARRALRAYDAAYAAWPLTVAFATCAVKASASDAVAQKTLERRPSVDPSRNAKFALWGGGYCGVFQHFMYNVWYPRLFKLDSAVGRSRWLTVAVTTAFELGVHFPFIANPVYYACNALFTGSTVGQGLRRYREEFWDIMTTVWMIWTPAQLVTFSVIPPNFRVAWVASVSFGWLIVLSFKAPMVTKEPGKDQLPDAKEA